MAWQCWWLVSLPTDRQWLVNGWIPMDGWIHLDVDNMHITLMLKLMFFVQFFYFYLYHLLLFFS